MKTFKAICAASVIALSLSIPAYADGDPGDIHVPGKPNPITCGPLTTPCSPGAGGATAVEGDLSFSDMLWALAWIF